MFNKAVSIGFGGQAYSPVQLAPCAHTATALIGPCITLFVDKLMMYLL